MLQCNLPPHTSSLLFLSRHKALCSQVQASQSMVQVLPPLQAATSWLPPHPHGVEVFQEPQQGAWRWCVYDAHDEASGFFFDMELKFVIVKI